MAAPPTPSAEPRARTSASPRIRSRTSSPAPAPDASSADPVEQSRRPVAWPLWAAVAGVLGTVATVVTDERAGDVDDPDYTVTVADIAPLDHELFRVGGIVGYAAVVALVVLAAVWHRRVSQRWTWSLGAPVVTFGLLTSAACLTLAYGWKGALGNYLHGAMEEGVYDDQGLYVYYVMNDFSPYIGWVGVTISLGGLAWMAFRERLVARTLGGFAAFCFLALFGATAASGVPGLPSGACVALVVVGVWLACGRSVVVRES